MISKNGADKSDQPVNVFTREERMREFVHEALTADAAIEAGAMVYPAKDVHAQLKLLAVKSK